LSEWAKNSLSPWQYLCVCSDDTVNKLDDQPISTVGDLPFEVTTNPADIAEFLSLGGERIIFSTYQSSAQVAKAQEQSGVSFDLVICDEAHRLTGKTDADYATVLDEKKIVGQKRLFMTATPRTYTTAAKTKAEDRGVEITSMDDEHVYGPVLHKLSFGEAIKQDLLSDYRVLIVGVTDPQVQDLIDRRELVSVNDSVNTDARTLAAHIGLAKATKDYNLKRTISFHSRIKSADQFATDHLKILDWLPDSHKPSGNTWTGTISGAMNTGDRRRLIKQLSLDGEDRHALLTNARCLTEGVDVPSLDGVAFIDPRSSQVDIIQAVGRAIRKSANKEIGTIVLPVLIPTGSDAEHALEDTSFKPIWAILNALKSHDDDFAVELNNLRTELGRTGEHGNLPYRLVEDLPVDIDSLLPGFSEKFSLAILEHSTSSWDWWFGLLQGFLEIHGHTRVPDQYTTVEGAALGSWVMGQRKAYKRKEITPQRITKLNSLTGWTFDAFKLRWVEFYDSLVNYVEVTGTASVPSGTIFQGKKLGQWVQTQRNGFAGKASSRLDDEKIDLLESLPGWYWSREDTRWDEAHQELLRFELLHGHLDVPQDFRTTNGILLASWISNQRNKRNKKPISANGSGIGTLTKDQERLLEEINGWTWNTRETQWEKGFKHLLEYVEIHGKASPPTTYVSQSGFNLGAWISTQRMKKKGKVAGNLDKTQISRLESLPLWTWKSTYTPARTISAKWRKNYELLKRYADEFGTSTVHVDTVVDSVSIGRWASHQRVAYRSGDLEKEKANLLEALPRWDWNPKMGPRQK
jgi:FlaG/FlaF family flagellin (archaellin)